MSRIDFYTNPMSRGQIVRWALHEVGADHETHVLGYGEPMNSASYRAINPMGKVPTIRQGDAVVTEFSASTSYAGRDAISYREAPGSGSPIRWYVLVSDSLQVSIGCQGGDQGQSLDAECAQAVSSVRISPR